MTTLDLIQFIDPTGAVVPLPVLEGGPSGRFMPILRRSDDVIPGQAGVRRLSVDDGDREVSIPVYVEADALNTALGNLAYTLDPTRGVGRLRFTNQTTGEQRIFRCRYSEGMSFSEDYASEGLQLLALTFTSEDVPYLEDVDTTEESFVAASSTASTPWFPLILPFSFSVSEVFATREIVNGGHKPTYPVWTVQGPGNQLTITHAETGKAIKLTGAAFTLAAHQTVTIDTRPRRKTVTRSDDAVMFNALSDDSEMFPLLVGPNTITVEMAGATSDSVVTCSFVRYWNGPA
jgi:hypothetical protein